MHSFRVFLVCGDSMVVVGSGMFFLSMPLFGVTRLGMTRLVVLTGSIFTVTIFTVTMGDFVVCCVVWLERMPIRGTQPND